jgi:hypothetical protein
MSVCSLNLNWKSSSIYSCTILCSHPRYIAASSSAVILDTFLYHPLQSSSIYSCIILCNHPRYIPVSSLQSSPTYSCIILCSHPRYIPVSSSAVIFGMILYHPLQSSSIYSFILCSHPRYIPVSFSEVILDIFLHPLQSSSVWSCIILCSHPRYSCIILCSHPRYIPVSSSQSSSICSCIILFLTPAIEQGLTTSSSNKGACAVAVANKRTICTFCTAKFSLFCVYICHISLRIKCGQTDVQYEIGVGFLMLLKCFRIWRIKDALSQSRKL